MACACALVTAYQRQEARSPAERARIDELAAIRNWSAKDWSAHFILEEDPNTGFIPRLLRHPDPKVVAYGKSILAQHAAFRAMFARGRMPSRAALLSHALLEERAIVAAGLIAA